MLEQLINQVLTNASVKDKLRIAETHDEIGAMVKYQDPFSDIDSVLIPVGDDCAAIPDGHGGYLLFSAEGIIAPFIESSPWFAGYSAVMVNISDVCAMGGLPLAVTDVMWLKDQEDGQQTWAGMKAASEAYGVPIVGGHTCYRSEKKHLAVSILGKAGKLLTSYDASPGDEILMAIDLNGNYFENYPFWNASTTASPRHLKNIVPLMNKIACKGLADSAKDISMGGIIGTLAMLLNTSGVGGKICLQKIPKPELVQWEKWLISFPSYGFLISAKPENAMAIKTLFHDQQIACESIGEVIAARKIDIHQEDEIFTIELN